MTSKNTAPVERNKAKVGDVRSVVDGTTTFWTKQNLGNTTITGDTLKDTGTKFDIPQPKTGTATTNIQGAIESNTDAFKSDLESRKKLSEAQAMESFKTYTDNKTETKGETALTDEAYSTGRINEKTGKKESVDSIQNELDDIQQQILSEQTGLRRTVENIDAKGGGLEMGANAEIRNATRDSLRTQADLSLIQLGIQGRFDSAKSIADRAVDLQLEEDKLKNETLKEIYERNQAEFTKDEQREFETNQNDRERSLDVKEKDLDRKYALVLDAQQNGAPTSVVKAMLASENATGALEAGGSYVGLLDRQSKLASIAASNTNRLLALAQAGDAESIKKLGFDPRDKAEEIDSTTKRNLEEGITAADNLIRLAEQYGNLVDTYGYTNEFWGNATLTGTLSSLRGQMSAAYKDANQLGTLDKGVETLLTQILGDLPISGGDTGKSMFTNFTGKKSEKIVASVSTLLEETRRQRAASQHKLGLDQDLTLVLPEDEDEIDTMMGVKNSTETGTNFDPNQFLPKTKKQ